VTVNDHQEVSLVSSLNTLMTSGMIVGGGGLLATLATRFPAGMPPERASLLHEAM